MATIRKPKLRKYAKKPALNATIERKQNFIINCAIIDKENAARLRKYDDAIKKREQDKTKSKKLSATIAGIGRANTKAKAKRKR